MKQAIVNADDFGICAETNLAIERAFRGGILTSASLMPNVPGFEHAVQTVLPMCTGLGVGIHLVLTTGRPLCDPADVPLLVDGRGLFRRSFVGILALISGRRADEGRRQIERELGAQFERLQRARVAIDHVNSHQHVHMIPAVWKIVVRLAARFGCPAVRLGPAPTGKADVRSGGGGLHGNLVKRIVLTACAVPTRRMAPEQPADGLVVRHPDHLVTAMDRTGMDRPTLARVFAALPDGVTEIVTHPSLASMSTVAALAGSLSREDLMFLSSPGRRRELEALLAPELKATFREQGIVLTSFAALSRPGVAPSLSATG